MKSALSVRTAVPALKALGLAAALACCAGSSWAADATLSITSFTASTTEFSDNYVWTLDAYQSYTMSALDAGGLNGAASDSYSSNDWNQGLNRLAQTGFAQAVGNTVQFTDALTQLATGGFNLGATSLQGGAGTLPNYANATALQSGAFTLIDANGLSVAGTITFDIYYDLSASTPAGGDAGNYAQTVLNLLSTSDGGGNASFDDGLLSTTQPGGVGATSGHVSWTFQLGVGEVAYYTLSGSAIASAAAVPEPGTYALLGLGLFAVAGVVRRRRAA